ncbi:MAG TPA: hypothetical protein GX699_10920 [Firmicutes bacterium]|nr:hypothetical protein [Bacillota bacterium]
MPRLCIAVADEMLAAALGLVSAGRQLSPQETLRFREQRYRDGNSVYPAWYLFGCKAKAVNGMVEIYRRQGAEVFLCPASLLEKTIAAEIIDTQFCSLPEPLFSAWQENGLTVLGYLPVTYAAKTCQAKALQASGGARFLPLQQSYTKNSIPRLPAAGRPVWLVKSAYGAAGRNRDGTPYTVWQQEYLQEKLPSLLARLPAGEELICSEFVFACDPYAAYADHVVHKMHFLACPGKVPVPYGRYCQRFIHRCNHALLQQKKVVTLGEFIGQPQVSSGTIDSITAFDDFAGCLAFLAGRVIFSVDFIVPQDGVPRFLEINKLAGTFAETFEPSLPPLIDYYAGLPLAAEGNKLA